MAERSSIEWCDATFNPWIGCTNVSPGCDHCYAEQQDKFRGWTPEGWGAGKPRRRTSEQLWNQPLKWNDQAFYQCESCNWRGTRAEWDKRPCGCGSLPYLKHARRRVFCASLADVFDNEVDPQWRHDLFALILATPNLDWLLLTKRIGNVPKLVDKSAFDACPNIRLGATIVNQEEADRDIPKLLATQARVRFLSMEPLLGPVNVQPYFWSGDESGPLPGVDWVIVGGESGPKARPMHPDWARSLRDQCTAAGVPFLFKQWGEWAPGSNFADHIPSGTYTDFDETATCEDECSWKVGKKAAGRVLDGRTHDGFPEVG